MIVLIWYIVSIDVGCGIITIVSRLPEGLFATHPQSITQKSSTFISPKDVAPAVCPVFLTKKGENLKEPKCLLRHCQFNSVIFTFLYCYPSDLILDSLFLPAMLFDKDAESPSNGVGIGGMPAPHERRASRTEIVDPKNLPSGVVGISVHQNSLDKDSPTSPEDQEEINEVSDRFKKNQKMFFTKWLYSECLYLPRVNNKRILPKDSRNRPGPWGTHKVCDTHLKFMLIISVGTGYVNVQDNSWEDGSQGPEEARRGRGETSRAPRERTREGKRSGEGQGREEAERKRTTKENFNHHSR